MARSKTVWTALQRLLGGQHVSNRAPSIIQRELTSLPSLSGSPCNVATTVAHQKLGDIPFFGMRAMCTTKSSLRQISTSAPSAKKENRSERQQGAVVEAEEEFSAITDKIPQRPVSMVEGTSYTLVIIAALGFAAAIVYAALNELLFQPMEYLCYNQTVERLKDDPRVTVRLGNPVSAYGTESRNRAARQRIPHRAYNDNEGREHVQLQFHLRGPLGRATVNADMYKDNKEWRYKFLYLDVQAPVPQQLVLVKPGQVDEY